MSKGLRRKMSRVLTKRMAVVILTMIVVSTMVTIVSANDLGDVTLLAYNPELDDSAFRNPLKGWMPFSQETTPQRAEDFHVSLVYAGVTWAMFEPQKGVYDFAAIEAHHGFNQWAGIGAQMAINFLMDNSRQMSNSALTKYNANDPHWYYDDAMDIPKWLHDEMVAAGQSPGYAYRNLEGLGTSVGTMGGFSPNYHSDILLERHRLAIQALAERYNNDPRVAMFWVGSLGHWGELHTWLTEIYYQHRNNGNNPPQGMAGLFPEITRAQQFFNHYDVVQNKYIASRRTFSSNLEKGWGLYDLSYGVDERLIPMGAVGSSGTFLHSVNSGYNWHNYYIGENETFPAFPNFYDYGVSGGELSTFTNSDRKDINRAFTSRENSANTEFLAETIGGNDPPRYYELTMSRIEGYRTTYLGPNCPALNGYNFTADQRANVDTALNRMGYRYIINRVEVDSASGGKMSVSMDLDNDGVARLYATHYKLEFSLVDDSGAVVHKQVVDEANISQWTPGKHIIEYDFDLSGVDDGVYKLAVAILDGLTGEPAIRFANLGDVGGTTETRRLGLNTVKITDGSLDLTDADPGDAYPDARDPWPEWNTDLWAPPEDQNPRLGLWTNVVGNTIEWSDYGGQGKVSSNSAGSASIRIPVQNYEKNGRNERIYLSYTFKGNLTQFEIYMYHPDNVFPTGWAGVHVLYCSSTGEWANMPKNGPLNSFNAFTNYTDPDGFHTTEVNIAFYADGVIGCDALILGFSSDGPFEAEFKGIRFGDDKFENSLPFFCEECNKHPCECARTTTFLAPWLRDAGAHETFNIVASEPGGIGKVSTNHWGWSAFRIPLDFVRGPANEMLYLWYKAEGSGNIQIWGGSNPTGAGDVMITYDNLEAHPVVDFIREEDGYRLVSVSLWWQMINDFASRDLDYLRFEVVGDNYTVEFGGMQFGSAPPLTPYGQTAPACKCNPNWCKVCDDTCGLPDCVAKESCDVCDPPASGGVLIGSPWTLIEGWTGSSVSSQNGGIGTFTGASGANEGVTIPLSGYVPEPDVNDWLYMRYKLSGAVSNFEMYMGAYTPASMFLKQTWDGDNPHLYPPRPWPFDNSPIAAWNLVTVDPDDDGYIVVAIDLSSYIDNITKYDSIILYMAGSWPDDGFEFEAKGMWFGADPDAPPPPECDCTADMCKVCDDTCELPDCVAKESCDVCDPPASGGVLVGSPWTLIEGWTGSSVSSKNGGIGTFTGASGANEGVTIPLSGYVPEPDVNDWLYMRYKLSGTVVRFAMYMGGTTSNDIFLEQTWDTAGYPRPFPFDNSPIEAWNLVTVDPDDDGYIVVAIDLSAYIDNITKYDSIILYMAGSWPDGCFEFEAKGMWFGADPDLPTDPVCDCTADMCKVCDNTCGLLDCVAKESCDVCDPPDPSCQCNPNWCKVCDADDCCGLPDCVSKESCDICNPPDPGCKCNPNRCKVCDIDDTCGRPDCVAKESCDICDPPPNPKCDCEPGWCKNCDDTCGRPDCEAKESCDKCDPPDPGCKCNPNWCKNCDDTCGRPDCEAKESCDICNPPDPGCKCNPNWCKNCDDTCGRPDCEAKESCDICNPKAVTYLVTVQNGTGGGNFEAGYVVTITANDATSGQVFDRWTTSSGITFTSATSMTTTFTMPAGDVTVTATYRAAGGESTQTTQPPSTSTTPPASTAPFASTTSQSDAEEVDDGGETTQAPEQTSAPATDDDGAGGEEDIAPPVDVTITDEEVPLASGFETLDASPASIRWWLWISILAIATGITAFFFILAKRRKS